MMTDTNPQEEKQYLLTEYSRSSGCGCKIAPSVLQQILKTDKALPQYEKLLVGNATNDDAAVYQLNDEQSLISTTDFFTPIVDDPYLFGRIAAANAISDVYAMGGNPIMAIAILGWPVEKIPSEIAQLVLEGARATCAEAGIPLAGGHSIDSEEPIFGLSVNGLVRTAQLKRNNTAQEGDLLFLTKPIGAGILATAQKRKRITPEELELLSAQLVTLNKVGGKLSAIDGVTAMTDVTGFGLLGHLYEMAEGSGLSAELYYGKLPIIEASKAYASERVVPDATYRNWNTYSSYVKFEPGVNVMEAFNLLPDPQTNGGLLIAVRPEAEAEIKALLAASELQAFAQPIGRMIPQGEKLIEVKA
jgi:selenide,water dikinase